MAKNYTDEEADEFLNKVEDLDKQIKGIIDGSISIEEIDKQIDLSTKVKDMKEREDKDKEELRLRKGRKGKGHKGEYLRFCSFCFTEYDIETEKCYYCERETITRDERMEYLKK